MESAVPILSPNLAALLWQVLYPANAPPVQSRPIPLYLLPTIQFMQLSTLYLIEICIRCCLSQVTYK